MAQSDPPNDPPNPMPASPGPTAAAIDQAPPDQIPASIVVPTRGRPAYLQVALASIVVQASAAGAEVLVIDDEGRAPERRAQVERFGASYEPHERPLGLNVARNTGVERSHGDLVVFIDDDVEAEPGWLGALLEAAAENPDVDVFAGAIKPRLEGSAAPRGCGREGPPITALDLGPNDTETEYAWGANMAIRRSAFRRVGPFDVSLQDGGDEQEWQERLRATEPGTKVLYVAGAVVDHRRVGADARLRGLAKGQYARGRAARRFDARRGQASSLGRELTTLAGCGGHVVRRRCPAGLTMVAHSAGRVREAALERATRGRAGAGTDGAQGRHASGRARAGRDARPDDAGGTAGGAGAPAGADDFLSGASGTVGGIDGAMRGVLDAATDALEIASARRLRLSRAARHEPPRRKVLAIGVVRQEHAAAADRIRAELMRSRHAVELHTCAPDGLSKFENLNRLLADHPAGEHDWLLTIDDDVTLPKGFLDRLLYLSERFGLKLAQPAHAARSHAAWKVTRRRFGSVARETSFVEIGPVTAFGAETFGELLPFPDVKMGWGLDAHWAALARARGWRCGVIDAVAISHLAAPAADAYSREAALAEARAFLAGRPYLRAGELQRTLTTHRRW
jgi:GT2 family glycosyltransferase